MSSTVLPTNEQRRLLERATLAYMENIHLAEEYLAARGIPVDGRTAGLGVVDQTILEYRAYVGRLAIPYFTNAGPVNMVFRCLEDHRCGDVPEEHHKYMRATGLGVNLYNVQAYHAATDFICITEGEIDALSCKIMGIPAIGVPGAKNWKDHWNLVFQDFERVFVLQDGDKAGKEFGLKVKRAIGAIRIDMPNGDDVNSTMIKHGYEWFEKALEL